MTENGFSVIYALRRRIVPDAHMAIPAEDTLIHRDAVGGDEILHQGGIGRPRAGGWRLGNGGPARGDRGDGRPDPNEHVTPGEPEHDTPWSDERAPIGNTNGNSGVRDAVE